MPKNTRNRAVTMLRTKMWSYRGVIRKARRKGQNALDTKEEEHTRKVFINNIIH